MWMTGMLIVFNAEALESLSKILLHLRVGLETEKCA
jgi:hypothetical protein